MIVFQHMIIIMDHLSSRRLGLPQVVMDWGADITPTNTKRNNKQKQRERRNFKETETGYRHKHRGANKHQKLTGAEACAVQMENHTKPYNKMF